MSTDFLKAVRLSLCFVALALAACEEGPAASNRVHPNAANEGAISFATDMGVARAAHTATRLRGGDVLVAGGFGESEGAPLASAELYDAGAGSFVPIGDVTTPRQSHTATRLPDGPATRPCGSKTAACSSSAAAGRASHSSRRRSSTIL